jgi:hypothetical protein
MLTALMHTSMILPFEFQCFYSSACVQFFIHNAAGCECGHKGCIFPGIALYFPPLDANMSIRGTIQCIKTVPFQS